MGLKTIPLPLVLSSTTAQIGKADWLSPEPAQGKQMGERHAFLAVELAKRREFTAALIAIIISTVIFLAAVPFAKTQLGQVPAFLPTYVSALIICDLITAVLLFGQFHILRSSALLSLASGYLFTATITTSYALMFPGLYSPTGLLGAGPQSTSAMYMFWHAGFPLCVILYAILKKDYDSTTSNPLSKLSVRTLTFVSIIAVLVIVSGFTLFVTAGHNYLPLFIEVNRTSDLGRAFLIGDWVLSFVALLVLLWRRPYTVIDLWVGVVMCVWLFDIALAAILNSGRYDLGWSVGRIYGLVAPRSSCNRPMTCLSSYPCRMA
jgi:hypothetical protein